MPYIRPNAAAAGFQFAGGYTRPIKTSVNFTVPTSAGIGVIGDIPTPLGVVTILAYGSSRGFIEVPTPLLLGSFSVQVPYQAFIDVGTPLGSVAVLAFGSSRGFIDVPTPLSPGSILALNALQSFVDVATPLTPMSALAFGSSRGFVDVQTPLAAGSFLVQAPYQSFVNAPTPLGAPLILGRNSITSLVNAPTPLNGGAFLAIANVDCRISVGTPLANPLPLVRTDVRALVAVPTPLNSGLFVAQGQTIMLAKADSPLGGAKIVGFHDFTTAIVGEYPALYVVDLVNSAGLVTRVPISSWQATLQSGASNYVQCVIPAALDHVDAINSAVRFIVSRRMNIPGLGAVEHLMAESTADTVVFDQGPERYTSTLSGYTDGFEVSEDPLALYDRTLADIRSISINQGMARVRCSIDWLLRPSQRAYVKDLNFVVAYINYYVNSNDSYMDVGER